MFVRDSPRLRRLAATGVFTPMDLHLAGLLDRLEGKGTSAGSEVEAEGDATAKDMTAALSLATALVSRATDRGDVCLDLARPDSEVLAVLAEHNLTPPPLAEWKAVLATSPRVGGPDDFTPLVLDGDRLYLRRYFSYERQLLDDIPRRALAPAEPLDPARVRPILERLFPRAAAGDALDWQQLAVLAAARARLCIITGGPGTGKTFTVARLLVLLLELAGETSLRVELAAPTGKAAARMSESLRRAARDMDCPATIKDRLPLEAKTLHRLLGVVPDSPYFRHTREHPLALDLLVVDEVSMVDLPLMAKLFQALPDVARLVLLGDRDQLASVEAGAVMGDLCPPDRDLAAFSKGFLRDVSAVSPATAGLPALESPGPCLEDMIAPLRKSWRFDDQSGIGGLARAVREGDGPAALEILRRGGEAVTWLDPTSTPDLDAHLAAIVAQGYGPVLEILESLATLNDPDARDEGGRSPSILASAALAALDRFRVLTPLRQGPWGVEALNERVLDILARRRLLRPRGRWFHGRPLMILRNDYGLKLFNGDVGLVCRQGPDAAEPRVAFPDPQAARKAGVDDPDAPRAEGPAGVRWITPARLPEHETVFAMTVHKSQGSEFDEVLLALPEPVAPVMTRELLYTAVTRARTRVTLVGTARAVLETVSRRVERSSGLRQGLWGATSHTAGTVSKEVA